MKLLRLLPVLTLCAFGANAQLAIKTNILYDATTTPNIGAELGISTRSTINLVYGLNPWTFDSDTHGQRKAKHWVLQPEYRWWHCSAFNGSFVGVHALGGQLNASNVNLPIPGAFFGGENLQKEVKTRRYEAAFLGAGVTYGYQWIIGRHWNFEAEIGAGYIHAWYDKFYCDECGRKIGSGDTNYVGLTKLGLSVLYIF